MSRASISGLYKKGLSVKTIANRHSVTEQEVRDHLTRYGYLLVGKDAGNEPGPIHHSSHQSRTDSMRPDEVAPFMRRWGRA